jgi:hypothetical protein
MRRRRDDSRLGGSFSVVRVYEDGFVAQFAGDSFEEAYAKLDLFDSTGHGKPVRTGVVNEGFTPSREIER